MICGATLTLISKVSPTYYAIQESMLQLEIEKRICSWTDSSTSQLFFHVIIIYNWLTCTRTCEICNSVARNVVEVNESEEIEKSNENNSNAAVQTSATPSVTQSFWRGHRLLNFLLACMVFAFVISWLFHFNVPSTQL